MTRLWLARMGFWLNRFHGLTRVERMFSGLASPTFVKRTLFGFDYWSDLSRSTTHQLLYLEGERFIEERFLLKRLIPRGATVVDVGANIGYYLLLIQRVVGDAGHVVCIEPSCENLPELRRNIEANHFTNVDLFPVAIGAEASRVGLRSGVNSGVAPLGEAAYTVEMLTLADVVQQRKVDFLKIDVEGFEGHVLEGAWSVIERDRPILFLELHPHLLGQYCSSTTAIVNRLRSVYATTDLYERRPPGELSLTEKSGIRYLGRDATHRIKDPDAYLRDCDDPSRPHTFWVVART